MDLYPVKYLNPKPTMMTRSLRQLNYRLLCQPAASINFIWETMYGSKQMLLMILISAFGLVEVRGQSEYLFDSEEVLEFTLRGDLRTAFRDRGDDPQYHKATLRYEENANVLDIPIRIKTRGNSRKNLSNCTYPPIFLNFAKATTPKSSIFRKQDKTKLVVPCQGDQFVIHEYLVYKVYNLVNPKSFKARLVKVIYEDTVRNKSSDPLYGMLLEEEKQMAKRYDSELVERERIDPKTLDKEVFLKLAVFQYLVANTDWSIEYQQNFKFILSENQIIPTPVPYDFDRAGIVRAPYAKPAPELKLSSTKERRYRGYCIKNMDEFADVFAYFNELKPDIYAIYDGNPLLSERYQKMTLNYLDDFYEVINNPKKAKLAFTYPCDPNGTGNVIIKGLN